MNEVNQLLAAIHRLNCGPRISTRCVNGNPDDFEFAVTWTRLLRLDGYSRGLSEQCVTAPTLPEALRRLIEAETKFDADERARLQKAKEGRADGDN